MIPLFQTIAISNSDTLIQNLTTDDQINPNKRIYFFLFSKTFPMISFYFFYFEMIKITNK